MVAVRTPPLPTTSRLTPQLDLADLGHRRTRRWIEYSGSASLMIVLIAISVGLREQNTLACLFVLMWVTMYLGLFTELYSRPIIQKDQTNYQTPLGRLGFIEKADYVRDPNALHLLSQSHWEGENRVLRDQNGKPVANQPIEYIHAQRCSNYVRRR